MKWFFMLAVVSVCSACAVVAVADAVVTTGAVVVKTGAKRAGGTYQDRANHIALWNTVMEEYNYAARAWDRFIRRVNEGQK